MRFGIRRPPLRGRNAARTSWRRVVRHNLGPQGAARLGWVTNPRKAACIRVYNRTTVRLCKGCLVVMIGWTAVLVAAVLLGLSKLTWTGATRGELGPA